MNRWMDMAARDEIVATIERCAARSTLSTSELFARVGLTSNRFYDWKKRRGRPNTHNASVPKDGWLAEWETEAILAYFHDHSDQGYRRLTYMMLDDDVVAVSPSSVYRVLRNKGLLRRWAKSSSKKGQGFEQPLQPHEHWHSDISYLNIAGTFYYFFGLIDGASRAIVHWEIREAMKEADLEIVLERAKAKYPHARPRIISDNGPQYVAREFHEFIRLSGMTHVRTSPYYPQSNGKIERFHGTLKRECIRPKTPVSLDDARDTVARYIEYYNTVRLHSAIGYVAPAAVLEGRVEAIQAERRRKLEDARRERRRSNNLTGPQTKSTMTSAGETETGNAGAQPDQGITGRDFDAKRSVEGGENNLPSTSKQFVEMLAHA